MNERKTRKRVIAYAVVLPEGRAHGAVTAALRKRLVGRFAVGLDHADWPGYSLLVSANMPPVIVNKQNI